MYQMKLSRSAQHEPVRGFWCRVCETCYKSREGYNDHQGTTSWIILGNLGFADRFRACTGSYEGVFRTEEKNC